MIDAHEATELHRIVDLALEEDLGTGDVTARLVGAEQRVEARVISRESAVIAGRPWVDRVFDRIDPDLKIQWHVTEGERVTPNQVLFSIRGVARSLLTGERTALNFLQTLSATATTVASYVAAVDGTGCRIVDTRKTIPGLRSAQKYAVRCGGGLNHRVGLFDGILIKENHIAAAGGLREAIRAARALGAAVPLMAEAETIGEARIALEENVDLLLIDNFALSDIRTAVELTRIHRSRGGKTQLEYSGNVTLDNLYELASTGVDRIAIGALTKHIRAIDLSMRVTSSL